MVWPRRVVDVSHSLGETLAGEPTDVWSGSQPLLVPRQIEEAENAVYNGRGWSTHEVYGLQTTLQGEYAMVRRRSPGTGGDINCPAHTRGPISTVTAR
jgi:hypothetical protein